MFVELSKGTVVNTEHIVYVSKTEKTLTIHMRDGKNLTVIDREAIKKLQKALASSAR